MTGYLRFSLLNKLNVQLRAAYETSANIACEQVAAIRTVASLNREIALHTEFIDSLQAPVRQAMNSTLKITFVRSLWISLMIDIRFGSKFGIFHECVGVLVW
jgi:ATP-binding cassette, subfamily B (MDR/TAP), member 1